MGKAEGTTTDRKKEFQATLGGKIQSVMVASLPIAFYTNTVVIASETTGYAAAFLEIS